VAHEDVKPVMSVSGVQLEPFTPDMTREASRVLARAFVGNPLHVATFGAGHAARNEAFFRIGLGTMKGTKLVAVDQSRIVGLIHWVRSPRCQPSVVEKLRATPPMLGSLGLPAAWRLVSWLSAWSACDPDELHVHLGPIGVDPDAQRRHIGLRLMERYCEDLDRTGQAGYLETDRPENVRFYGHFGFEITREIPVAGVPNYMMWRPSSRDPSAADR
jgi:ribosomal protein S18 acetylase RimI-like enzyme